MSIVSNAIAEVKALCKITKTASKKARRDFEAAEEAVEEAKPIRDKALSKAKSKVEKANARAPYLECLRLLAEATAARDKAKAAHKAAKKAKEDLLTKEQEVPEHSPLVVRPQDTQAQEDEDAADRMVDEYLASQPNREDEEEAEDNEEEEGDLEEDAPVAKAGSKRKHAMTEVLTHRNVKQRVIDMDAEAALERQRALDAAPKRLRDVPQREAAKSVVMTIMPEFREAVRARNREAETGHYGFRRTVTPDGVEHNTLKQQPRLAAQREIAIAQEDTTLCILGKKLGVALFEEAIGVEQLIARDELFDHGLHPDDPSIREKGDVDFASMTKDELEAYRISKFWSFRKTAKEALAAASEDFLVEVNAGAQALADELARGALGKKLLDQLKFEKPDEYVVKRAQKVAREQADEQGMTRKEKSAHVRKAAEDCEARRQEAQCRTIEMDISSFVEVQPEHIRIAGSIVLARMAQIRAQPSIDEGLVLRLPTTKEQEAKKHGKSIPIPRVKHIGFKKAKKAKKAKKQVEEESQEI